MPLTGSSFFCVALAVEAVGPGPAGDTMIMPHEDPRTFHVIIEENVADLAMAFSAFSANLDRALVWHCVLSLACVPCALFGERVELTGRRTSETQRLGSSDLVTNT